MRLLALDQLQLDYSSNSETIKIRYQQDKAILRRSFDRSNSSQAFLRLLSFRTYGLQYGNSLEQGSSRNTTQGSDCYIKVYMQDDSNLKNESPRKSRVERASSFMTDSFRMAASVLGTNTTSRKAHTLTVAKLQLKDKNSYKKQPQCQICFVSFGKFDQHHCRVCANAVCSSCSYSTINKERACDKCAYHYSDIEREQFKQSSIKNLTNLCVQFLANKHKMELQLKGLQEQIPSEEDKERERRQAEERGRKMNERLEQLAQAKRSLQAEIASIRSS